MESARNKVSFLTEMFRGRGEVFLSSDAREGLYLILSEINDSLAAEVGENSNGKEEDE